jgi:isopentenyl phosphate kinase
MILDNGKPVKWNLEPLKGFFRVGLIPLIPPDGAFDVSRGFGIVSGDVSAAIVAKELKAKALIFGVDVDGLLRNDELVERLSPEEAIRIAGEIEATDVTGGMSGKLKIAADVASSGIPVYIVNLLKPGRLRDLLSGKNVPCTRIG